MSVITLCGSTRFTEEMLIRQWELSKQGHVVMGWCVLPNSYSGDTHSHLAEEENVQEIMDVVHKKKIDLSDYIIVINVRDYIGESTKSEILYALEKGKGVEYVYPHVPREWENIEGF
jgi:hypothetical protein